MIRVYCFESLRKVPLVRFLNLKNMKKLIYILVVVFATTSLVGCQKEDTPESSNDATSYFYSMKDQQFEKVITQIYEIDRRNEEMCEGFFIQPLNQHFDFIVEIEGGLPEEILRDTSLAQMEFEVDLVFTGVAYNCKRSYKTEPNDARGYPVEIQKARITKYSRIN